MVSIPSLNAAYKSKLNKIEKLIHIFFFCVLVH